MCSPMASTSCLQMGNPGLVPLDFPIKLAIKSPKCIEEHGNFQRRKTQVYILNADITHP